MSKPFVVLADLDANYLVPLEDKLTEELCGQIELEIITSREYFDAFFSTPKKIDTLIIANSLLSRELMLHNISDVFVLTEDYIEAESEENITYIYKYSSTKEIFNQVIYKNKQILNVQINPKKTQVIVFTSAIGGSGKTTLSFAFSESLAKSHKRVLYISTDTVQSFSYYLQNKANLPNDIVKVFSGTPEKIYNGLIPYLRNEGFTYLPPLSRSLFSMGLDNTIYCNLIKSAKESMEYDFIVVDTDVLLDEAKTEIIQNADKVFINVLQDEFSTFKTEYMLRNIDCRNGEKFVFICNKFRRDVDNCYVASNIGQMFIIAEYIDEVPLHKIYSIESFAELNGVRNLAYMFT